MDRFLPTALQVELFRIATKRAPLIHDFTSPMVGFGTCLGAEIMLHLAEVGLKTTFDPDYAIHYGLESIGHFLELVVGDRHVTEQDIFIEDDGAVMVYPLNLEDLRFRGIDAKSKALDTLQRNIESCRKTIQSASIFLIACATARTTRLRYNGRSVTRVSNLDDKHYESQVLDVPAQINLAEAIIDRIHRIRGDSSDGLPPFIFLISPQRYPFANLCARDGRDPYVDSVLCKSILRVAVEEVVARNPGGRFYFPAYEMVIEELRVFDSLAHYDFQHVGRLTNPYLAKRFIQTFADEALIAQLNIAVQAGALRQKVADHLRGGGAPSETSVLDMVDRFHVTVEQTPGPLSPVTRRTLAEIAKLLGRTSMRMGAA